MSDKNMRLVRTVYPGSYCYDSASYNNDRNTRFKVTDGPGARDCADLAEGPTDKVAWARAARLIRNRSCNDNQRCS